MRPILFLLVCLVSLSAAGQQMIRVAGGSAEGVEGETQIRIRATVREFLIASTETTQADYERVMGGNPSFYKGPRRPVENFSWWDAIRYCNRRSEIEGAQPCYDLTTGRCDRTRNGYRLPSEAEWGLAARGADPKQANLGGATTKDVTKLEALAATGTRDVGSFPPNALGLHDMIGNVWEWNGDYFNAIAAAPVQGEHGLERIIRGGSFLSTTSGWARGYRGSLAADAKSRFTGFRVCRTIPEAAIPSPPAWETYTDGDASIGNLRPLLPAQATRSDWERIRGELLAKWRGILGAPQITPPKPQAQVLESWQDMHASGQVLALQTEPDSREKMMLLRPHGARGKLPVLIVPYYDVDVPAGRNLGGRVYQYGSVRAYAQLAAQRGFLAVAIRWYGESYGERYDEAVLNLRLRHPQTSGLGKWVWDAQRLLDYLQTLPDADMSRIAIMGHSLGAKMALYAAALDERIGAVVFSEGGIGFAFSNYDDFWYLGERMRSLPAGTDQHELLGLIAPRPFLLIAGEEYDGEKSRPYLNAAKPVYRVYGKTPRVGMVNHGAGHSPTPDSISRAMAWLEAWAATSARP